jgi:short-subunit dehydrogenase involved in D-alanine esterification of teichoic acids
MGKSVIITGRTESKLKSAASEIDATARYVLDTGDVTSIPIFVSKITKEHPEVEFLIKNAMCNAHSKH